MKHPVFGISVETFERTHENHFQSISHKRELGLWTSPSDHQKVRCEICVKILHLSNSLVPVHGFKSASDRPNDHRDWRT
jgi:hypothetical protein